MEGSNIKWAEFHVINSMGSPDYMVKRVALLTAHLVIDHSSQGLIMVTNLFKKVTQTLLLIFIGTAKKRQCN